MRYLSSLVSLSLLSNLPTIHARPPKPAPVVVLESDKTIYQPPNGLGVSYARYVELANGTLLVTSALQGSNPAYFPVFSSTDEGRSWRHVSNITDQVNGWGFPAQPALTELTEPLFGYAPGTIFAAGNSWSSNGTRIDLYASTDRAETWKFVSHVAMGGPPDTTNGKTPVWEPYLLIYKGQMVVYYSDQRDSKHGQKLSHQTSCDLKTWSPPVNDVAYPTYIDRPGMTVVAYIKPMDKWILVHEFPVGNSSSYGANYPVYYRMAKNPLEFASAEGIPIVVNGTAPNASPYVSWSPLGGKYGTIVVSDADHSGVYTNRAGGDRDKWELHATPQPPAYSRAVHIFNKAPDRLMIVGGASYGATNNPPLSFSIVDLMDTLKN